MIGSITSIEAGCAFFMLWLLWCRSKRIDKRNDKIDRWIAAIGQILVELYPEQGSVSESRAAKKAKALAILRRIDDHDLDSVRLAIHEVSRAPFDAC